jgi:hypothetical protein
VMGTMMDADDRPLDLQSHMAGNGGEWFMPMMRAACTPAYP